MSNNSNSLEGLIAIYNAVNTESRLGNNSVVRRIKANLLQEIREASGRETLEDVDLGALGLEGNIYFRSCGGAGDNDPILTGSAHLSFNEVRNEISADDRRRSVFLDPQEAATNNFIDFYSGRLESLEMRTEGTTVDLDFARKSALESMRENFPLIDINMGLATSAEELVLELRGLADIIEADIEKKVSPHKGAECIGDIEQKVYTDQEVGFLLQRECNSHQSSLGTRWRDNGRRLEQGTRITVQCCTTPDPCCGNQTCDTTSSDTWTTVWQDGSTGKPPPVPQPGFQRRPWDHQIPLIPNDVNVDQTSDWGWRNLGNSGSDFHGGIDIAAPVGTEVFNVTNGVIVGIVRNNANPHNQGVIVRTGGTTHTYWHIIPSNELVLDAPIGVGTTLGEVAPGSAVHLHYGTHQPPGGDHTLRSDENSVDPLP